MVLGSGGRAFGKWSGPENGALIRETLGELPDPLHHRRAHSEKAAVHEPRIGVWPDTGAAP